MRAYPQSILILTILLSVLSLLGGGIFRPVHAQSILSQLPANMAEEEDDNKGNDSADPFAGAGLETLFAQVGHAKDRALYEAIKARFLPELNRAAAEEEDTEKLREQFLISLLKAGDGVAPPEEQEQTAREYIESFPDEDAFPLAFFYLTSALYQQGKSTEDSFFFDDRALKSLPGWVQTRYLRMQADSARKKGRNSQAATFLIKEKEWDDTLQQTTEGEVLEMLERMSSVQGMNSFIEEYDDLDWLTDQKPFLTARVLINEGKIDKAMILLEELQSNLSQNSTQELKRLSDIKTAIRERLNTRPERIGVLLPLSSSSTFLRQLAMDTLDGIRMAIQFSDNKTSTPRERLGRLLGRDLLPGKGQGKDQAPSALRPGFELVIRDTANNPGRAAEMVQSLVEQDQVIAIIGPLARSESIAATEKGEEMGVPVISFSVTLEIPEYNEYVFRHSMSQENEVRDLVRYAIDYLHVQRFAILYPDTRYGNTMMEMFREQAEKRQGKVVAASAFIPTSKKSGWGSVEFKQIFDRFTGRDRPVEKEDLALMEAVGDSLPDPIVDFDAIFIPIGPDGIPDLQLIAPYPITVDAENALLLGSRFWNDDSVLVAGDGKLEGAVFVDTFDRSRTNPKVSKFQSWHRSFYGHRPTYQSPSYYTGLGFDTINIIKKLVGEQSIHTRKEMSNALRSMKPYIGATGLTAFNARGEAVKESMFFHIRAEEIQRILP